MFALSFAALLRTTVPSEENKGKYYYVPDQNPFYPQVIEMTKGVDCFGNVFLCESFGAFLLVLCVLHFKEATKTKRHLYAFGYCLASIGVN